MKKIITKFELRKLVLNGITTKDLNDNYDYSGVNDMSLLFNNCETLRTIPELDTENVENMSNMFAGCLELTEIPYLETKKVKRMNHMFYGCKKLTTIPELNTENVENMTYMFFGCTSLTDLPYLETKNVENMSYMFSDCTSFNGNLSKWNVGKVITVREMFNNTTINPTISYWILDSLTHYDFQEGFTREHFEELKTKMGRLGDLIVFL